MDRKRNVQYAPYPNELEAIVTQLRYRPGWRFGLSNIERDPADSHGAAAGGLTFIVTTKGYDSYHIDRGEGYRVAHYFPVPAATYNAESWLRWLLDCILKVEQHECCEFFALASVSHPDELERPFAPTHGPGDDPYVIHEYASDQQRRTRFTGEVLSGRTP